MKKLPTMYCSSLQSLADSVREELTSESKRILANWEQLKESYAGDELVTKVRDKEIRTILAYSKSRWAKNTESVASEI